MSAKLTQLIIFSLVGWSAILLTYCLNKSTLTVNVTYMPPFKCSQMALFVLIAFSEFY